MKAMRLELRQIEGPTPQSDAAPWYFEHGRRTLGRSGDCDWQIRDTTRSVSKLHCTILRDREGFLLRDESANGTRVDDRLVAEGESARLAHDGRLQLGAFVYRVVVSGEREREIEDPAAGLPLSDETLTVSSILADVSPGGQTASGILPGRLAEDWLTETGPDAARDAAGAPTGPSLSRNVEIGWNGPPALSDIKPVLPDDWNAELDYTNRLEHSAATFVSVPVTRRAPRNDDGAVAAERSAPTPEPVGAPEPAGAPDPALLTRLEALLVQCEDACAEAFAALDVALPARAEPAEAVGAGREEALLAGLALLAHRQHGLAAAIAALLRDASQRLEPRLIEARVDAASRSPPWLRQRSYWQAYRRLFSADGKELSVADYFRAVIVEASGEARRKKVVRSP